MLAEMQKTDIGNSISIFKFSRIRRIGNLFVLYESCIFRPVKSARLIKFEIEFSKRISDQFTKYVDNAFPMFDVGDLIKKLWYLINSLFWFLIGWRETINHSNKTDSNDMAVSNQDESKCPWCLQINTVNVDSRNIADVTPSITSAVESAAFIAIDAEFSGLGDRRLLSATNVDDRYTAISDVANSRSILALGLSCFKKRTKCHCKVNTANDISDETSSCSHTLSYTSKTFNILMHSSTGYMIDPDASSFLAQHGFDFNHLFLHGIKLPKRVATSEIDDYNHLEVHSIFSSIFKAKVPLILHNGLLDLCFIYSNFYGVLPQKLSTFLADLSEMFPNGIYDTKYISMFHSKYHLTQLEYIFKKCLQDNHKRFSSDKSSTSVRCKSDKSNSNSITSTICCPLPRNTKQSEIQKLCNQFMRNGHCQSDNCKKLHNVDLILAQEGLNKLSKQKKKKRKLSNGSSVGVTQCIVDLDTLNNQQTSHQAGIDAFMTGYAFAAYLGQLEEEKVTCKDSPYRNRLPLSRKDIPLQIIKSHFSCTSNVHNRNSNLLTSQDEIK